MDTDLASFLQGHSARCQPLELPEALGNAGGLSGATLWRFPAGAGQLVARAWPVDGPGWETLNRIHGWLETARRLEFVPVPVKDLEGRSLRQISGRWWELTPWMPGTARTENPPPPWVVREGFTALAAFHQALARESTIGPSPGLAVRRGEVEALLLGRFDQIEASVSAGPPAPFDADAAAWLADARRVAPWILEDLSRAVAFHVARQPCLRDARLEHFLFENGRLTGLVDFGAMGIDTVARDLARLFSGSTWDDPWLRGLALDAYSALRLLDPTEITLIQVFERSANLLLGERWVAWHYLEGRVFQDSRAVEQGVHRGRKRVKILVEEWLRRTR